MDYIFVALGGFTGAISRFLVASLFARHAKFPFPIGTLFINLLGSFLLGLLIGMEVNYHLYLLFGIGFMGAFTTFSTFQLEAVSLYKKKQKKALLIYIASTYIGGILLASMGMIIGKWI